MLKHSSHRRPLHVSTSVELQQEVSEHEPTLKSGKKQPKNQVKKSSKFSPVLIWYLSPVDLVVVLEQVLHL
jgi:hypothetical protein